MINYTNLNQNINIYFKEIRSFKSLSKRDEEILFSRIELGDKKVADILPKVKQAFADWKSDERDGLWLGKGKSWVHVRASNTEPVIRVIAEAPTAEEAEALCAKVEGMI